MKVETSESIIEYKRDLNNQVLNLLFNAVVSEGGDGWGSWLSSTPLSEVIKLIKDYKPISNPNVLLDWEIEEDNDSVYWGDSQTGITITNDEESYFKWIKDGYEDISVVF